MGARASLDLAASSLAVMSSLSSEISDQFEFIRVTDLVEVAETNETFICSVFSVLEIEVETAVII